MEYLFLKADSRTESQALNGILKPKSAEDKKYCRWLYQNYITIARHKSTKSYAFVARGSQIWAAFDNNITERKAGYFLYMQEQLRELRKRNGKITILINANN